MTNGEAIARLEMMFQECSFPQKRCKGDCCTCSKAIDALQAEVKEHQLKVGAVADGIVGYETIKKSAERYKTEPSDLISRADAVNEIQRYERHFNTKLESLYVLINELPSADAVKGGRYENAMQKLREMPRCFNGVKAKQIKKISADRPTSNYITESPNDVDKNDDEVIDRPIIEHDREWIIGCIKHDGFIKTDRFDKANQIILDALADRPSGEWVDWLGNGNEWECSVCKCSVESHGSIGYRYCPSCGARMENTK